jgi:glycosyltransferase involved in cell wall biosynthesis
MRVGVDGKSLQPPREGVARYLEGVLAGCAALKVPDLELDVITPSRPKRRLPWVLWDMQRATARGFDAFHFPFYYPPLMPRCPVTVAIHDVLPLEYPEWFGRRWSNTLRWMIPAGAKRATAVVTGAEATAEAIVSSCSIARAQIRVIPYGVDAGLFAPVPAEGIASVRHQLGLGRPYLLQLGALERRRGVDLALAATEMLRVRWPELELVLAGERRTDISALAAASAWVRRLGRVEEAALPALYAGAAAVLAPSRGEGFDFPVLEALACGALVVASDISVHVEHFAAAVRMFPSGDAQALADAVAVVLDDSAAAAALRARGPAHAARFSWKESARRHIELWREVAGR